MPKLPDGRAARAEPTRRVAPARAARWRAAGQVGYAAPSHFAGGTLAPGSRDEKETPLRGREDPPDAGREEEAADVPRRGRRRPLAPRRPVHRDHRAVRAAPGAVVRPDRRRLARWRGCARAPSRPSRCRSSSPPGRVGAVRGRARRSRPTPSCRAAATPPARSKPPVKKAKEAPAPAAERRSPPRAAAEAAPPTTRPPTRPPPRRPPPTTAQPRKPTSSDEHDDTDDDVDDFEDEVRRRRGRRRLRRRGRRRGQPHRRRPRPGRHRARHPQPGRRPRRDRGRRRGARATRSRCWCTPTPTTWAGSSASVVA